MSLDAPKLSLLSAMIVASIGAVCLPPEARAGETTLDTVITGSSQQTLHGYRKLVAQPNKDARVVRTLDGSAKPANLTDSFPVLAFGHMSDTQICDDQSPARVPFMDKRADIDPSWETGSAYRPQERLLPQMAAAMVSSLRNVGQAPQTGLPLAFTLITGDMIDNSQFNETRTYIDLMDGGWIRPNHWLNPAVEEGPGYGGNDTGHKYNTLDWSYYSTLPSAYYHPDGYIPYSNSPPDWYRQHDFPVIPNLLSASRRNFWSPGLGMPWYAAFGNHDMSIQGNLPLESSELHWKQMASWAKDRATGANRISEVDLPYSKGDYLGWGDGLWQLITNDLIIDKEATADPYRYILNKTEFMDEHFATTGLPVGHGFQPGGKPYYVMPSSGPNDRFKFIALDTTNTKNFSSEGAIDPEQWEWLVEELKSASSSYYEWGPTPGTNWPGWQRVVNPGATNKLIVLYGHHTLDSMTNTGDTHMSGASLESLLKRFPNVIMYVNGHTHENRIRAHPATHTVNGQQYKSGFWEVTSPAAADFPVQSRLIEVAMGTTGDANGSQNNNYLSIYTTMLDVDAPVTFDPKGALSDYRQLASVGRELSFNDPGDLPGAKQKGWRGGAPEDRNTQLILPTPFPMNDFYRVETTRAVHIVTQKADTKDAKIVRMKSDGGFSGTIEELSGSSLYGSEIIGTGTFTQGVKGRNFGNDLVLRDSAGNIRIKLLGADLKEVPYPGYGAEVRGSVASDSELAGIGDFDADGRADLVWRHGNGTVELWPAGSVIDRKYLNASNDHASPTPDLGSEQWKIVAVADFNGDGWPDLMRQHAIHHTEFIRYMHGITMTSDAALAYQYDLGFNIQPGTGHSVLQTAGDHLVTRKLRNLNGDNDYLVGVYDPDALQGGWQPVFYQNQAGWNAGPDWKTVNLGDFNLDGVHDILWRHDSGQFAMWYLRAGNTQYPFLGDHSFNPGLGIEWVVKGVLKNTVSVIY